MEFHLSITISSTCSFGQGCMGGSVYIHILTVVRFSVMSGIINAQDHTGSTALHLALSSTTSQWTRAEKILKLNPGQCVERQILGHVRSHSNSLTPDSALSLYPLFCQCVSECVSQTVSV